MGSTADMQTKQGRKHYHVEASSIALRGTQQAMKAFTLLLHVQRCERNCTRKGGARESNRHIHQPMPQPQTHQVHMQKHSSSRACKIAVDKHSWVVHGSVSAKGLWPRAQPRHTVFAVPRVQAQAQAQAAWAKPATTQRGNETTEPQPAGRQPGHARAFQCGPRLQVCCGGWDAGYQPNPNIYAQQPQVPPLPSPPP